MENTWKSDTAARIGRAVHRARKGNLTAEQLSRRCGDLGHPIHRTTITKIENGRGSFEVADLLILAAALGIPPISLLYPDLPDGEVAAIPEWSVTSSEALNWFCGDGVLPHANRDTDPLPTDYGARELLDAVKRRNRLEWMRFGLLIGGPTDGDAQKANRRIIDQIDEEADRLRRRIEDLGGTINGDN